MVATAPVLSLVRAHSLWWWKFSLLVHEFGHFLAVIPLLLIGAGWAQGGRLGVVICWVNFVAILLLLRPVAQAVWIGLRLPAKLEQAFGRATLPRTPFSWAALPTLGAPAVPVQTREFARAGRPDALLLDFYPALSRDGPAPCVVVIHGGGWDNGDRTQLAGMNHWLARRGYAVAAVSYRLAPDHIWPAQADDIEAALAYLKQNVRELGLDPMRFVLLGRSAGGQLSTAVAYGRRDPAVRGVVALYAPQDQVFAWRFSREDDLLGAARLLRQYLGGTPEIASEAYTTASAYHIATSSAPPTLLIHGQNDALVWHKQSERLHAKLNELRVPNALVSLPWATHAFDYHLYGPSGQLTTYAIEWFLKTVTK
ncbi:MAG: alpha/beta hydrolase [Verrucomicrobia bacterium]|nr:alpha/beta hydrolase [Verrucomicrobiota bacterium]